MRIAMSLALMLTLPLTALAEEEQQRKIVKTKRDINPEIEALMTEIKGGLDSAADTRVFVIKDDNGNVEIEAIGPGTIASPVASGIEPAFTTSTFLPPHVAMMQRIAHAKPITRESAACILDHLSVVQTDGAAALLREACVALEDN